MLFIDLLLTDLPRQCVPLSSGAGSAVGVALGTFGLPFVDAAFGTAGVRIALLWDLANVVAGA